jgi:hypothetical protein
MGNFEGGAESSKEGKKPETLASGRVDYLSVYSDRPITNVKRRGPDQTVILQPHIQGL